MIVNATYTSVWDGGYQVASGCKVDMDTKKVFDIEPANVQGFEILEDEFVTIDGEDHPVSDEEGFTEFWRD